MLKKIVLTLTGPDRVGIVDSVTEILVKVDGNVETSRMARLGGEFTMLMLISIGEDQFGNLEQGLTNLREQGFQVSTKQTESSYELKYAGWQPYQIEVHGADQEGIVHQVAHYLTQHGISIESMDTGIVPAPMSGTLFFSMNTVVLVPPHLSQKDWQANLDEVADQLNVEIKVSAYKGK
jgi:glycine cleavage system transcriptional repressor